VKDDWVKITEINGICNMWFDAHCHLQDGRLLGQAAAVLARARAAGVGRVLCCGTAVSDWPAVADLAARWPDMILPAFGLHPWFIADRSPDWLEALRRQLEAHPLAVVGEIGLDHVVKPRVDAEQQAVFEAQLALACEFNRPVVMHCRKAWGLLVQLRGALGRLPRGFVVHAYSGGRELVPELAAMGACFSFAGSVTWPHNIRAREAAPAVPADRLLVETDAPDLLPWQGGAVALPPEPRPNEPANVREVARAVAALRGMSESEVEMLTWQNACRIYQGV
jgi:TatD DNase family protein